MSQAIIEIIVLLLPFLIEWLHKRDEAKPNAYQTKINTFNRSLADRNAGDISLAFNRMRAPKIPGPRNGGYSGGPGSPGAAER